MAIVLRRFIINYKVVHNLTFSRTIMTSSARAEKAAEELKNNPYYEKYATKIATLQQTSPEEFLSRIEENEKVKNKPKFGGIKERQYSALLKPKDNLISQQETKDKSLNDIMKVELIKDKDSEEIKRIWAEYHIQKEVISATIPSKIYDRIMSLSSTHPTFIFPLPRSQGYEFIMCQFFRNTVHFTPLICYQVHKENAPECLTITHYTDLKDDKNIVLMRGEFDKDVIDAKEAQCLANQLQMFYGQEDEKKLNLLETFTNKPDNFKHMDLISELENLSL